MIVEVNSSYDLVLVYRVFLQALLMRDSCNRLFTFAKRHIEKLKTTFYRFLPQLSTKAAFKMHSMDSHTDYV